MRSDIAIFPGYFHSHTLPFHHWLRRLTGKQTFAWSEPLKNHPRTLAKSPLRRKVERALLLPCNSAKNCLLATGAGAETDYRELGMSRWEYRQFLFSISPPQILECQSQQRDGLHFVYCGALQERKGVDLLIQAISGKSLRNSPFRLTLLGDGPLSRTLHDQCKAAGIESKVEFLGSKSRRECLNLLSRYDVLVLPSRFDGWGAVINEAMEAGLAIVTSDQVGARRPLVDDGENGLIVQSGSVESLGSALQRLIAAPDLVRRMQKCSLERIRLYRPACVAAALADFCLAKLNGIEYDGQNGILQRV